MQTGNLSVLPSHELLIYRLLQEPEEQTRGVVMASGPESGAAEQPPALPVKQRRSRSSGCSSEESGWFTPGSAEPHASNEVFESDSTDCQAASCPIHQSQGFPRHQLRFFSDVTPPPVPKKKLARTLSLPAADAPPPSPLPPVPRLPQSFVAPASKVPGTFFLRDQGPPAAVPSLSQLSFDTPDEQLPYLFRNFQDQKVVFQGIQHRQILFLQSVAQTINAGILLQEGAPGTGDHPYLPRDFLLCEEATKVGDTVYYSLRSPKLPGRQLALKVLRRTEQPSPAPPKEQHVNLQHAVAHFSPQVGADSSPGDLTPGRSVAGPPLGGGAAPFVEGLLLRGHSVSVERDQPHLTLEEFVEKSLPAWPSGSADYHRQLCLLLLQVLTASQHLYATGGRAAQLGPAEILLVWPPGDEEETGRVEGSSTDRAWRRRGSPRVLLSPDPSARRGPQTLGHIKARLAALIHFGLRRQESLTSSYQHGLLHLASELQAEGSGLQMADAAVTLQVLLWGPRLSLLDHRFPVSSTVHNWLTTKRALLVLKLAEMGLVQDRTPLDWEDSLCLEYLSSTDSEAVARAVARLWPPLD